MLDTRPHLASYWQFDHVDKWPIEAGEPPTVHLLGDGEWADAEFPRRQRLVNLIAARGEDPELVFQYPDSQMGLYEVREAMYPTMTPTGFGRIIRYISGANLLSTQLAPILNVDSNGWIHHYLIPLEDAELWELNDTLAEGQPTSYNLNLPVPATGSDPIPGTWAEILGMTLSDVELPVEKHIGGTIIPDGVIPGRRLVITGSDWAHSANRIVPVNWQGIQNLLAVTGDFPPTPLEGTWPGDFGDPVQYYGPEGTTSWKLALYLRRQTLGFRAGIGVLATNDMVFEFIASLLWDTTPEYLPPRFALSLYDEQSPWHPTLSPALNDPIEGTQPPFPLESTLADADGESVEALDVGDLTLSFHALKSDEEEPDAGLGGFHDFRETTDAGTALETARAFLEGGDGLIYSGVLGELPRPHSGATGTFCGVPLTLSEYSLDVLTLDTGVRVALIADGNLRVWDWPGEELWNRPIAESFPPDILAVIGEAPPRMGYRFMTAGWPHVTGLLNVGGANLIIARPDRLHDKLYRVEAGKLPIVVTFGWADD